MYCIKTSRQLLTALLSVFILAGCNSKSKTSEKEIADSNAIQRDSAVQNNNTTPAPAADSTDISQYHTQLVLDAKAILADLKAKDFEQLDKFISPVLGLKFSPESSIQPNHQVFMGDELDELWTSPKKYLWGDNEAGEIRMTFKKYFESYVYDRDYLENGEVGYYKILRDGTTCIENYKQFYKDGVNVDFFVKNTSSEGAMDWSTLRLIFTRENGKWYLRHIIHDHWCI